MKSFTKWYGINKRFWLWVLLAVWVLSGTLRAQSPARTYGVGAAVVVGAAALSVGAQLLVERLFRTEASDSLILSKKIVLEVGFVPTYTLGLQGNNRPKGALLAHNPGMHQYTEVRYFPSKNVSVGLGLRSGVQFINALSGKAVLKNLLTGAEEAVEVVKSSGELQFLGQLTGDYFFWTRRTSRVSIGLGLGVLYAPYYFGGEGVKTINLKGTGTHMPEQLFTFNDYRKSKLYWIIAPRIGIEDRRSRMNFVFNIIEFFTGNNAFSAQSADNPSVLTVHRIESRKAA